MDEMLQRLLTLAPEPASIDDIDGWWAVHQRAGQALARPVHRAMAGGFAADRPGYAFASGYHEALRCLLADQVSIDASAGAPVPTALCATEAGGAHPRAIATLLEPDGQGFRMSGAKQWATLGSFAQAYIVLASVGQDDQGRNRLAAVRVPADRDGIFIETMPETPFVPEIPHARLRFEGVRVNPDERLPGDGYDRYLKPFRTIEDIHVHAAVLAWLLQVARRASWPRDIVERLVVLLVAAAGLAGGDASSAAVHIALAGLIAGTEALLTACEPHWPSADAQARERWQRDRALLGVAGKARQRRREVAWQRLGRVD
jgi:alkylation response protein AidB-like acyl-CoA dehydrogenase